MTDFKDYSNEKYKYSDGDYEDLLLKYFKKTLNEEENKEVELQKDTNWVIKYHLSPNREDILNWYPFQNTLKLLEIGGGCGALTGLLCDKVESVTSIELTKKRAEILKYRHGDKKNLKIIAGNISDISIKDQYDYVTCIGVLEYAGLYSDSSTPHLDFLKRLNTLTSKNGKLLLAIENKFGLKYWAGCKEDHTGKYFDSLENYPNSKIKTFSRKEIEELVVNSGYKIENVYFPSPDYKFPVEVFSEQYLPDAKHSFNPLIYPFRDESNERINLFNEARVMNEIINNQQYPFFANSFLIEAVKI